VKRAGYAALAVAVAGLAAGMFAGLIPRAQCPFAHFLGVACPMCGTTRALVAAWAGQWARAFALNPLFPLWAGLVAASYAELVWKVVRPEASVFTERLARWGGAQRVIGLCALAGFVYENWSNGRHGP
jgi:hypothetical protein